MERKVERVLKSQPTIEGAGVRLKRVFGYYEVPAMDSFSAREGLQEHSRKPEILRTFPLASRR